MKLFVEILTYSLCILCSMTCYANDIEDRADAMIQSLKEYRNNQEYKVGIAEGLKYLKEMEKLETAGGECYLSILVQLSYLYDLSGDYENAIKCAKEVADWDKKNIGGSAAYVASLNRLASFSSHNSQYREAIGYIEEARRILREKGEDKTMSYAILSGNIGTYYSNLAEFKKSIELHRESLELIEQLQGKDNGEYADRLGMLSVALYRSGNIDEAIDSLKSAIEILEAISGRQNRGYMVSINNLSTMQSEAGEYVDAMINIGIAKDISENLYGKDSPDYASRLSNYGNCQAELGKYQEAIRTLSDALAIRRKIYGDNHQDVAITLTSLGACYSNIGEYSEALKKYFEAKNIFENTTGNQTGYYAKCLSNISTVYFHLGNYNESAKYIDESCCLVAELYGTNHLQYAHALNNKIAIDEKLGHEDLELRDKPLEILLNTIGSDNNTYATFLQNKGLALFECGKKDEGIAVLEDVLSLRAHILGRLHPQYASTLYSLGGLYAQMGDLKKGIDYTQKSLSIFESAYGKKNPKAIMSLITLSGMQMINGNLLLSASNAIQCNELLTEMVRRMFLDLTSHERSMLWQNYRGWYGNVFPQIAFRNNSKSVTRSAYDAILFSKSILLNTDIELLHLITEEGNAEDIEMFHSLSDARRELTKVYELPIDKQKNRTDSIEKYIQDTECKLIARSKSYGDYTRRLGVSWQDVREALGPNDIAVEFSAFHNIDSSLGPDSLYYVAFVLKRAYDAPKVMKICSSPYNEALFKNAHYDSAQYSELVWAPLKDELIDVESIYFAPTAEFYSEPIEYFAYYGDPEKTMSDIFNMYRLSSTREIVLADSASQYRLASLFGGLVYDGDSDTTERDFAIIDINCETNAKEQLRDKFGTLGATKAEVDMISKYLDKMAVNYNLLMGMEGTEQAFRDLSKQNIDLLHVATHGFYWTQEDAKKLHFTGFLNPNRYANFSDEDKALARSGILLAGAETSFNSVSENFDPDDGIVTAKEIAQLDFRNMKLAVLSACQTGLGDIAADGVFGLQRGFKKAGVQSLLMSLWKVDDKATQLLMTEFYKGMSEGMSKVVALRNAQKTLKNYETEVEESVQADNVADDNMTGSQLRREKRNNNGENMIKVTRRIKPYAAPKYWAGFVLLDGIN